MRSVTIIVACGTSVATSTILMKKLQDAFREHGIPLKTINAAAVDVEGYIRQYSPDMVVATCEIDKCHGVPVFMGIPFITGIGEQELLAEIVEMGAAIWERRKGEG